MNREQAEEVVVNVPNPFILAELPTGFGKSKKMEFPYTLDNYVNEVISLINELKVA